MISPSLPQVRRPRESNLELMRIVLMLLIIAHHSVVNSGVMDMWAPATFGAKAVFLTFWGMWGKVCINSFVMITGYFMCTSRLTWVKMARLLFAVFFWDVVLSFVLVAIRAMGPGEAVDAVFMPMRSIDSHFVASFLVVYLAIPFLNALIGALSKRGLLRLSLLLLWVYTVCTTFFKSYSAFSEVGWYATLYFISAYIRLYPVAWFDDKRATLKAFVFCLVISVVSVAIILVLQRATGTGDAWTPYYFVNDSGKVLAFMTGTSCFLFFKNLRMPRISVVNAVASTTFGVLLIHANSPAMRRLLWGNLLDISGAYASMGGVCLLVTWLLPWLRYS